jgi:manganese transport protein
MYHKILVALENGPADEHLLPHVMELAKKFSSELLLLHVADGWAARCFDQLTLAESEEMKSDRAYLENAAGQMRTAGITAAIQLALGDPPAEIQKVAETEHCDLIAMGSHGHRWLGDVLHGSTITEVRHKTLIPILLVRGQKKCL